MSIIGHLRVTKLWAWSGPGDNAGMQGVWEIGRYCVNYWEACSVPCESLFDLHTSDKDTKVTPQDPVWIHWVFCIQIQQELE